jgi:hypothetical protein
MSTEENHSTFWDAIKESAEPAESARAGSKLASI